MTTEIDKKVGHFFGDRGAQAGDIGIELEAEGYISNINSLYWYTESDGSLRNGGREYVLRGPLAYSQVAKALANWTNLTKEFRFTDTHRTSCHVHINVRDLTIRQIYAIIGGYYLLDQVLTETCDISRHGNLFCLDFSSTPMMAHFVNKDLQERKYGILFNVATSRLRYGALNLNALGKFGSLEFRQKEGIYQEKEIQEWVDTLYQMVHTLADFGDPKEVLKFFYASSLEEFVDHVVKTSYNTSIKQVPDWEYKMRKGSIHLISLCKSVDIWCKRDKKKPQKPKLKGLRAEGLWAQESALLSNAIRGQTTLRPETVTTVNNANSWEPIPTSPVDMDSPEGFRTRLDSRMITGIPEDHRDPVQFSRWVESFIASSQRRSSNTER